jgi:DNA-binding response OmpR family regulator
MANLLLIDNDPRLVELVAALLTHQGHTVRTAGSFREARERLREERPDLALSDLDLGVENGRLELPQLAREGLLPPTLVVSGFLDSELDVELSAIPGVLGTISKPFDLDRLCERIDACLATEAPVPEGEVSAAVPELPETGPIPHAGGTTLL